MLQALKFSSANEIRQTEQGRKGNLDIEMEHRLYIYIYAGRVKKGLITAAC